MIEVVSDGLWLIITMVILIFGWYVISNLINKIKIKQIKKKIKGQSDMNIFSDDALQSMKNISEMSEEEIVNLENEAITNMRDKNSEHYNERIQQFTDEQIRGAIRITVSLSSMVNEEDE